MITTSAAYKLAINADSRHIIPKVEIYFDGDAETPTTFEGDEAVRIDFLEEARAEGNNPLGFVSANEVTITLDNSARDFTPTNTAGAYYGQLHPNILVKPYLGLVLPDDSVEYIPLGVYRTGDWDTPAGSVEATVTCYDRVYAIGEMDMPMLPIQESATIYSMFESLFLACGLTAGEYEIDTALAQTVFLGWLPDGKVRDGLQILTVAGCCNVNADRVGVVVVLSNFQTGAAVATLTDTNQVISAYNPQKYLGTYNSVKVIYRIPYLKESDRVLSIEGLEIPTGGLTMLEMSFTSSPVALVEQVNLLGKVNSAIDSFEFGANTITIVITNSGAAETVTLEVIGQAVDFITLNYTLEDEGLVTLWGRRQFTVDNPLIQTMATAEEYAAPLLDLVKEPGLNYNLVIRGDPSIEVNDHIQIQDASDKLGTVDVLIQRISFSYDGALDNVIIDAIIPVEES